MEGGECLVSLLEQLYGSASWLLEIDPRGGICQLDDRYSDINLIPSNTSPSVL